MKIEIFSYENKLADEFKKSGNFFHDISGNIYLKLENTYYVLMISATDDIEWIEIEDYELLELADNEIKYSTIKNTYEKNSLKGKITKELEDENGNNEEEIEDDIYLQNKNKTYPEEKLYTIDNIENNENQNDDYLEGEELSNYYRFSKFGNDSIIKCLDRTLSVLANYDTFVMNSNTSYILETFQAVEKSEYRVTLFIDGRILLNVVGTKLNTYNIFYKINNDKLEIICERIFTKFSIQ